jgi:hypothetical protein
MQDAMEGIEAPLDPSSERASRLERAEAIVAGAEARLGLLAGRVVAVAVETVEDVWAEAQAIRRSRRPE